VDENIVNYYCRENIRAQDWDSEPWGTKTLDTVKWSPLIMRVIHGHKGITHCLRMG